MVTYSRIRRILKFIGVKVIRTYKSIFSIYIGSFHRRTRLCSDCNNCLSTLSDNLREFKSVGPKSTNRFAIIMCPKNILYGINEMSSIKILTNL